MSSDPQLAAWLVSRRGAIERRLAERLGPAAPRAGADESEVLRRFRSYAGAALQRGTAAQPALDGLRPHERRVEALLTAWLEAAEELAGDRAAAVRQGLLPLLESFRSRLRATGAARRERGAPRSRRRAVMAAIDRVADAFLAVDAEDARVVDANPAAGALLGVARDALLGVDAMAFVPADGQPTWWTELDAMSEASEPRHFRSELRDAHGAPIRVDCSMTRFATRSRTLALILARPVS